MRKSLSIVIGLWGLGVGLICAQETVTTGITILDEMSERVTVYAEDGVNRLLQDKIDGTQREQVQVQGYRVQVFSSNQQQTAKNEAFGVEKAITESGFEAPIYVLYNPPFWKVRIGDFRTQAQAQEMKEEIIRLFPQYKGETYVVKDQIQIIQ